MRQNRTVVVTGATGKQGGATTRELLADGWDVRALVRDRDAPAARLLAEADADLVVGDLDDPESLEGAFEGAHGVFSVQPLAVSDDELAAEVRRGGAVVDAAVRAGVAHLVYSSVGGAERSTGIDHFESKATVEEHVLAAPVPATILRPAFFMDNLLGFLDAGPERVLELPIVPGRPLQMIASSDIGRVAAAAFAQPDAWVDAEVELAGDAPTMEEVAAVFTRVTGTQTWFVGAPIEERMFEWFAASGYQADVPALRAEFPWMLRFEDFLRVALGSTHAEPGARSER